MARTIRTIKTEILSDEKSAALSSDAWRLWVSMWLIADDHGRLRASPLFLKTQVFWATPEPAIISDMLEELSAADLITRYYVKGQAYVSIPNWDKHQRIDYKAKSLIPSEDQADEVKIRVNLESRPDSPNGVPPHFGSRCSEGKGRDRKGKERIGREGIGEGESEPSPSAPVFDFEGIYKRYPRKQGKADGLRACKRKIKTPEQFDLLILAVANFAASREGEDPNFTPYFSTWINKQWEDWITPPAKTQKKSQWLIDSAISAPVKQTQDVKL